MTIEIRLTDSETKENLEEKVFDNYFDVYEHVSESIDQHHFDNLQSEEWKLLFFWGRGIYHLDECIDYCVDSGSELYVYFQSMA